MKVRLAALFLIAMAAAAAAEPPRADPSSSAEPLPPPATQANARVAGLALDVVNVAAALKFYTQGLGMQVTATREVGSRTETVLTFSGDPGLSAVVLVHEKNPAARRVTAPGGSPRLVLGFPDLDAVAGRLARLGYSLPPVGSGVSGRTIVMTDPSGVAIELVQSPAS